MPAPVRDRGRPSGWCPERPPRDGLPQGSGRWCVRADSGSAACRRRGLQPERIRGRTLVSFEMHTAMLQCQSLGRTYRSGDHDLTVLKDITFSLEPGGFLAILGPSGSGKPPLLGLLAGLDQPSTGTVSLDGQELGALTEDQRARIRGEKVGFVFQAFQLIPTLTAPQNAQVPLELRRSP